MTIHSRPMIPSRLAATLAMPSGPVRLPDQITLQHGPVAALGRFFLAADKAARDRGVYLSLSTDFELLREVNRMNLKHWHGLAPSFDASFGGINADCGYWLIGRSAEGEIVSTQAAHFYDMGDETLQSYLTSLRLFYPDPERQKNADESCSVSSPSAASISGRVVFSGSTWIHPDYRGRALPKILPRLSRALALTNWNTDYTISLVTQALVDKGVAKAYGYTRVEPGVQWLGSTVSPRYMGCLVWMPRSELLEDIARFDSDIAGDMQTDSEAAMDQRALAS